LVGGGNFAASKPEFRVRMSCWIKRLLTYLLT